MNSNPFEILEAKLDALAVDVRTLKSRTNDKPPADEVGGLEMAEAVTGLSRSTLYKKTHRREIPHRHVGGRLYFRRAELLAWLDAGRRPMASEVAVERMMAGNK
jgi:excisionase family DNA binding protein